MSLPWTLRRAGPADVDVLALIGATTFHETYAGHLPGADILAHCMCKHHREVYAAWLDDRHAALWLAEAANGAAPVGYQVVAPPAGISDAAPGDLELVRIYTLSKLHGGGAGQAMMDEAIAWSRAAGAPRLLVALWQDNHRAMAFYRGAGFAEIGTRPFTVGAITYTDPVLALPL